MHFGVHVIDPPLHFKQSNPNNFYWKDPLNFLLTLILAIKQLLTEVVIICSLILLFLSDEPFMELIIANRYCLVTSF